MNLSINRTNDMVNGIVAVLVNVGSFILCLGLAGLGFKWSLGHLYDNYLRWEEKQEALYQFQRSIQLPEPESSVSTTILNHDQLLEAENKYLLEEMRKIHPHCQMYPMHYNTGTLEHYVDSNTCFFAWVDDDGLHGLLRNEVVELIKNGKQKMKE